MENKFAQLGVAEPIVAAIEKMGFETPTKVQEESIPKILDRKDLIVMSKTGSGKTGAFGIPILQAVEGSEHGPKALILTPTRELAVQVDHDLQQMGKNLSLKTTAVYGQHNMNTEIKALKDGAAIVSGTPGRVFDHIKRKTLITKNMEFLVLDEADRMLDMGFIDQVIQIIKSLPRKRVTLLFSATMPPEIQRICKSYMYEPESIELETETKTVDTIRQIYYRIQRDEKRTQLERLLKFHQPDSCMIFCNTRIEVDRVQSFLNKKGFHSEALHGANKQHQRMKTINSFKKGQIQIMVATDVAARGIHIDELSMVINYDVPEDRNSYVHRIGRTGRAGNSGLAFCMVTGDDIMTLYEIEEHVGCLIDETDLPSDEEVAAAVEAAADSKWAKMDPPKLQQPKKREHDRKKSAGNRSKSSGRGKSGGQRHHDSKTDNKHTHKRSADSHKHAGSAHDKKAEGAKQYSHKSAHGQKQDSNSQKPYSKTAQKPVTGKSHDHKPKHHKTPKRKTKTVMTKMGPIEMIVNEPEKKSFMDKIKGLFGK